MDKKFFFAVAFLLALPLIAAFQGRLVGAIENQPATAADARLVELTRKVEQLEAAVAELKSTER